MIALAPGGGDDHPHFRAMGHHVSFPGGWRAVLLALPVAAAALSPGRILAESDLSVGDPAWTQPGGPRPLSPPDIVRRQGEAERALNRRRLDRQDNALTRPANPREPFPSLPPRRPADPDPFGRGTTLSQPRSVEPIVPPAPRLDGPAPWVVPPLTRPLSPPGVPALPGAPPALR